MSNNSEFILVSPRRREGRAWSLTAAMGAKWVAAVFVYKPFATVTSQTVNSDLLND